MKPAARVLHALVALSATAGVLVELVTAIVDGPGAAPSQAERIVRLFSFFTVQSNTLVAVASALLAWNPDRDGRVFRVLRLDALLCIAVTGVVYHTALSGLRELTPSGALANLLLHTISPVGAVVVWLLVGPRPRIDARTVWWAVAYPMVWIAYTFARGAAVHWYPYPFLDVTTIGYGRALVSTGVVAVLSSRWRPGWDSSTGACRGCVRLRSRRDAGPTRGRSLPRAALGVLPGCGRLRADAGLSATIG